MLSAPVNVEWWFELCCLATIHRSFVFHHYQLCAVESIILRFLSNAILQIISFGAHCYQTVFYTYHAMQTNLIQQIYVFTCSLSSDPILGKPVC